MNNTLIAIIIGIVVVGGGAFFLLGSNNTSEEVTTAPETTEREDAGNLSTEERDVPENFTGTIAGLLALGRNVTCTFNQQDDFGEASGTVYVLGEQMRGDFTMQSEGETFDGSVIRDGDTIYSWGTTPFGTFATKVSVAAETNTTEENDSAVDFNEEIDYSCSVWRVDRDMFNLPTGVEFEDLDAQMQEINQATGDMLDLQCSACDNIPDPAAQAQCRATLGCS